MADQIAVVTGGAGSIGRVIAKTLVRAGAQVALVDLDLAKTREVARTIDPSGRTVHAFQADVAVPEQLRQCALVIEKDIGAVTALSVNAGIMATTPAVDITEMEWDRINNVNMKGAFFTCQAFAGRMLQRGHGSIVLTSSTWGIVGFPERATYAATKTGIVGIMRSLAVEWGPLGVRVNAVCPSAVATDMNRELFAKSDYCDYMFGRTPLRRFAEAIDVANAIHFLLSRGSAMITGQALAVDGGWTAL
jgi:2-deoxy-D-gluconate 3-dehydrogenase